MQTAPVVSIVDDDKSVRQTLQSLVRSLGFTAHTFASAEEFLKSPHVRHTACLITDLQMPGMSGIELQTVMAQQSAAPVIFLTAFPEERMKARALQAGALGFLTKPFDGQMLIGLIEQAVRSGDRP